MPRLQALGGLAILGEQGPLSGSAARGRNLALLALLARAGAAGVSREKAASLLWPESDSQRSRHSLDQALYTLRRAIGPDVVRASATTLVLDADIVKTDVTDFDEAIEAGDHEAAVNYYSGPFLDGFHLPNSGEFERWVDGERADLHRRYVASLETVATAAMERGETADGVAFWRRLAAAEPLSSRIALGLMSALDQAGDRTGALEAFRVHAALVSDELGSPPDPSVVAFEKELRSRRGPREAVAPGDAARGPAERPDETTPAPEPAPAGPTEPSRVGRRWIIGGVAALTASVIVAGLVIANGSERRSGDGMARVSVVPFENETGDTAYSAVGRMAADWIIEGLVRTGLVQVVEQERSAESVVSGRIYLTADSLRVNARITSPDDGAVLRAIDAVTATPGNPASALEPLRQRVLGALGTLYDPRLAGWADIALRPPRYTAYLEFVAGLDLSVMPRDLRGASERFERAIALDPDFMAPRLWTAWMAMMADDYPRADSLVGSMTGMQEAMSSLERAWLDRMQAVLAGDHEASLRAARRMVDIAPRSAWVIALANAAFDQNRPREAISTLRDAGIESLGQEAGYGAFVLAMAYHQVEDYHAELAATEEGIRVAGPSFGYVGPGLPALAALGRVDEVERRLDELRDAPPLEGGAPAAVTGLLTATAELRAHGFEAAAVDLAQRRLEREAGSVDRGTLSGATRQVLIDLYYEVGRLDEAERLLRGAPIAPGIRTDLRGMEALIALRRGDMGTARSTLADLASQDGRFTFGNELFWRARIESALGNHDRALSLLAQAFDEGQGGQARYVLHTSRDFQALREDARFRRMMEPGG